MSILVPTPLFWLTAGVTLLVLAWAAYRLRLRWRPALVLRSVLVAAALFAATLPELRSTIEPPPLREVLVVDQSDSLSPEARAQARVRAGQWLGEGANRLVLFVGAQAVPLTGTGSPVLSGGATDLAEALHLASGYLGTGPGRVVIATDGRADDPLAVQDELDHIRTGGPDRVVEMISLLESAFPADVTVGALYLPTSLWENTAFTAVLPVVVTLPGDVLLTVRVNENVVLEETLNLPAGRHLIPIALQTSVSEIMTVEADVESMGDPRPENNTAFAALRVFDSPRVLVVTQDPGSAGTLAQALGVTGLDTDLALPEDLPESLNELSPYEVIMVDNILAERFSDPQLRTLRDFVQQLGRGLIFTGGRNAFTLGGYKNTLIEPALPVRLEPPPREQNSPLTLVLVLDRSASMEGDRGSPASLRPISLAREAALRSVETLGPEDFLGILSYNANPLWSLPIQQAGSGDILQNAKNAMAALSPSGGTAIYDALATAVAGLIETQTTETRHIVLLSDGNDDTPIQDYIELAAFAVEQEISISTIALGTEADQELMALLAQAGKGRYYPVLQATDLPKILIDESQAARDENIREGPTQAVVGEANHPALSGLSVAAMPPLFGYNALESKTDEGAEDVLLSAEFEDPLLSVWQYGLGRVAAWTGDLGSEWAPEWREWEDWGRFWSNVIRYTLPDPAFGPGQVEVQAGSESVRIIAQVHSGAGVPRNGVPVTFKFADPSGEVRTFSMPQTAPGEYALEIPRPADGVYRAVVGIIDDEGFPVEFAAPVVVDYPDELRPAPGPAFPSYGPLVTWSELLPETVAGEGIELAPNKVVQALLVALLILWPLEIAVRRRRMPWR